MNTHPIRTFAPTVLPVLLSALLGDLLPAQSDSKPAPTPDPVKGWHDPSPLSPAELDLLHGGRTPHTTGPVAERLAARGWREALREVAFDRPGDDHLWVRGSNYKASFGRDGFVYVPFLGSQAPRNFPLHFVLREVRVGGMALALPSAEPQQDGHRITFARGGVREIYDVRLDTVEQTFVVDTALAGDVEIELEVRSELREDAAREGIQFGNELGCVEYGQAHVVVGDLQVPVPTVCEGDTIRIHVPAAQRGAGPLVVDPIIQTSAPTVGSGESGSPDIAYDVDTDCYLVVWQQVYSAADLDVWSQRFDGSGNFIAGSLLAIDFTATSHGVPRVANLNSFDRWLVVFERYDAALARYQIWGRMRLANLPSQMSTFLEISSPAFAGDCRAPDVGGDPGTGLGTHQWLIVWTRELSAIDHDIHARTMAGDGTPGINTLFLENSANTIYSLPSISQSNAGGLSATPRWMVAYQYRFSATDWDVYGCALNQFGVVTTSNTAVDTSIQSDLVPSVSSAATDFTGSDPLFLLTYERQAPQEARARLLSAGFVNQIPPVSLTASFGFGPFWVRTDSDGCRFAVTSGSTSGVISVATLAYTGSALVLHEAPQVLAATPFYPRIASKRSGGGVTSDHGLAYVDTNWAPDRIVMAAYEGRAANAVQRRVMGCNGLGIDVVGRAELGHSLTFTQSNTGTDIPGHVLGNPFPASNVLCPFCLVGVDLAGPTILYLGNPSVLLPCDASLVGHWYSVQGFALGSGPCLLDLRFSDTIDFLIG